MQNQRNELAVILPDEWQALTQQANALVASGFLPQSVNSAQKAIAIMTLGRELGVGAWAALSSINVIQGKPTVSPQLMLALINRSGQLEDVQMRDDGACCTVTMKRKGRTPHTVTFSMQDAAAMGLSNKDNWKKQPAIMRQWRAVAAAARVVFPDVVLGLYTPEEMGANVVADEQGNMQIIDVRHEEPLRLAPKLEVTEGEIVSTEQPSSTVRGAGIPQAPKFHDPTPEELERVATSIEEVLEADLVGDVPPNLHHVSALIVSVSKTAKQFAVKVESGAVIHIENMAVLDGLLIGDKPVVTLDRGSYAVEWTMKADKTVSGWDVQEIVDELVPA